MYYSARSNIFGHWCSYYVNFNRYRNAALYWFYMWHAACAKNRIAVAVAALASRHGLWGARSPKCCLALTVKHTDQESRGELCKIFKFWLFLQSKFVNNVCKLLQLLGDFDRPPDPLLPPDSLGDFCPQDLLGYSRQMKIPSAASEQHVS